MATSEHVETETTLDTVVANAEGYTGFTVRASMSKDYQSATTELHYQYAVPVDALDLVEKHAEASTEAANLVRGVLANVLDKAGAAAAPSGVERLAAVEAPSAAPAKPTLGRTVLQGTKPQNGGVISYVATSELSEQDFKTEIAQGIRGEGYDPEAFVVFDNRKGKYGVEDGKESWAVAAVMPKQETHMASVLGDKTKAFFVDFDGTGTVKVKATNKLEDYTKMAAAWA